jgi:peptide deformylase
MILPIVKYGHPVLRQRGKKIEAVTPEIRQFASDMIETMRAANGVGLAAQQVGRAVMLTVIDVRGADRPSTMQIAGADVDVGKHMPLVLVNPVLSELVGEQNGGEGCLSFPGVSADIRRAEAMTVDALGLDGEPLRFRCSGLLARAIQHEVDHLNAVLFVDRMDSATKAALSGDLKRLYRETEAGLKDARKASRKPGLLARALR